MPDPNSEMSLPQLAAFVGVKRQTAYVWAIAKRIEARKVAGRFVVTLREAERVKRARAEQKRRATT